MAPPQPETELALRIHQFLISVGKSDLISLGISKESLCISKEQRARDQHVAEIEMQFFCTRNFQNERLLVPISSQAIFERAARTLLPSRA